MGRIRLIALVLALVALVMVAVVTGVGDGADNTQNSPLEEATGEDGRRATAKAPSAWADLGIGALGGAVVGALATHFRERAEQKRHEKEKETLATLVSVEVRANAGSLDFLGEHPQNLLSERRAPPLAMRTWEDARVRLAQLMPCEDLVPVMNYYLNLQLLLEDAPSMRNTYEDPELPPANRAFLLQQLANRVTLQKQHSENAQAHLYKHTLEGLTDLSTDT
jgi:hypothetical protein